MCTRFFIDKSQEELSLMGELAERSPLAKVFLEAGNVLITNGEIRPTNVVPAIAPTPNGKKSVYPMKWGFSDNEHGMIMFNARSESAGYKPTFKEQWISHRCVIPASYYFEWKHYKTPDGRSKTGEKYVIQPKNCDVTWLCGLYRIENNIPVFVILTKEADKNTAEIHDRMPVIIPKNKIDEWISPKTNPSDVMPFCLNDMVADTEENFAK